MKTPQTTVVFGQKGLGRKDKEYFAARVSIMYLEEVVFNQDYIKKLGGKWLSLFNLFILDAL